MQRARALLPYAIASLIVVASSAVALSFAVVDVRDLRAAREAREAAPSATPAPRSGPELSRSGRLAYWRTDPAGASAELFVANLDGSLRRSVTRLASVRRASLTRWTPTGDAVVYVDGGAELVRVDVDGGITAIRIPADARAAGYVRIVDHRWSTDGSSVVATVVRADLRSDVFVARADDREMRRLTTIEDVFATDWLDDARVLVNTGGGVVAVLRVDGAENALRPLVGMSATSPILADDGRIHFLAGSVTPSPRDSTLPYLTASGATVWSVAADGADLRQETRTAVDDVRLDARYGPGRYLGHRGASSTQVLISESVAVPPIDAGAVERAVLSLDGRSAIGFSSSRMIRFDVAREPAQGSGWTKPTVVLDQVGGGDAWYPRAVTPVAAARAPAAVPQATYALPLGGHLWSMTADGVASFLRAKSPQTGRRTIPLPQWSPDGSRLLTVELAGQALPGIGASTPVAVTIDRNGNVTRHVQARAAIGVPSWSPEGDAFVVIVDRRGIDGFSTSAELEARFLRLDGGAVRPAVPARDAVWTRAGVVLLTDRAIELITPTTTRTVVELDRVLRDPAGEFPTDPQSVIVGQLTAPPDGAFASFRLNVSPRSGASRVAIAVVRVADGAVMTYLPGSSVADISWSPASGLLGYTVSNATAEARDLNASRVAGRWPGRFAGWTPDGRAAYVAMPAGLFVQPLADGESVRVSSIGVPVSATALR
ncbi:MAG TPA: hypothetical protein VFM93_05500 [Candidatus Limnocylindria bacterium]|nr:hypothetical protein [Candidatus Limnocylindria bacterium]